MTKQKKTTKTTKKKKIKLEWKRAKRDETECATRRTWESRCGLYKIQESVSKFGLAITYYSLYDDGTGWAVIDRRQKRNAAEKACEAHRMNIR